MAKAYGKLILLGEHAVVYGVPAIACGLERGLDAHATRSGERSSSLSLLDENRFAGASDALARAFEALLSAGPGEPRQALSVRVSGDLPPGMNLGFSAAAAVAIARAIEEQEGRGPDDAVVGERADAWERVFHGNPSGIDVAAAMHGGFIRFRRGEGVRRLVPARSLRLCIGLSGTKPGPTKRMVDDVAAIRERDPLAFQARLDVIGTLVDAAATAIERGDLTALGDAMNRNHAELSGWGLSTDSLEVLCHEALVCGALGAKLTGAGGGGAMVALAGAGDDPEAARVAARILGAWSAVGRSGFEVVVGADRE